MLDADSLQAVPSLLESRPRTEKKKTLWTRHQSAAATPARFSSLTRPSINQFSPKLRLRKRKRRRPSIPDLGGDVSSLGFPASNLQGGPLTMTRAVFKTARTH